MKRVTKLPPAFKRYAKMGGVLHFAVFEEADGSEEEILAAMAMVLGDGANLEALRAIGRRIIDRKRFLGDWCERGTSLLLKRGDYRTEDGTELRDPRLKALDGLRIESGGAPLPEAGAGGQFAYAFSSPPYSLRARPSEVQAVFDEILIFILPPLLWSEISDWTSPKLVEVSDYFTLGMDWWGAFLFSLHVPALGRLTLVAGSTTD